MQNIQIYESIEVLRMANDSEKSNFADLSDRQPCWHDTRDWRGLLHATLRIAMFRARSREVQ